MLRVVEEIIDLSLHGETKRGASVVQKQLGAGKHLISPSPSFPETLNIALWEKGENRPPFLYGREQLRKSSLADPRPEIYSKVKGALELVISPADIWKRKMGLPHAIRPINTFNFPANC